MPVVLLLLLQNASSPSLEQQVRQLGDDSYERRERASRALLQAGEKSLPLLEKAKQSNDPEIAARAYHLCGQIREKLRQEDRRFVRGVGIVVGLNGTGDSADLAGSHDLPGFLRPQLEDGNLAIVEVTALVPPESRPGTPFDVRVRAIFDARSIHGGTLFLVPLIRPSNPGRHAAAVAQGRLVAGDDLRTTVLRNGAIFHGFRD